MVNLPMLTAADMQISGRQHFVNVYNFLYNKAPVLYPDLKFRT